MDMKIPSPLAHREHKLRIGVGHKKFGRVANKSVTWGKLLDKLSEPQIDLQHTLEQYLRLNKDEQADLKNIGWFIGGHGDGGERKTGSIKDRWLVTLDVDECTPAHVFDLQCGMTDLAEYEFFVYSTRKHTKSKPRLRIIIPLASACEAEAYHALSRILTEKFDSTMESTDPVSFRVTQLMYYPSVCKDADFFTFHNHGKMVEPGEVLKAFGDWRDHTKLPRSERDDSQYNPSGRKPEDPETKEGLVGAFCRVYDVPGAIEEFLSDIYIDPIETAQGTRFTYAGGTTSHGAIVYDQGKFLYSNHMHDPAAGHSQNAFDLVRLHLFGELDKKAREGTSPMSLPSVKAMVERVKGDKHVAKELRDHNYDLNSLFREPVDDDGVFDELEEEDDPDLSGGKTWVDELDLNNEGIIKPSMNNIVLILMNDPRFEGCVRRNLFNGRMVYMRELDLKEFGCDPVPNYDPVNGSAWTDTHTLYLKMMFESPRGKGKPGYGLFVTKENLHAAVELAAERQAFHPVKDYLNDLKWDGKKRAETLFIDFLGADDTPYHREVCRLTLLAAVTRIFEPGHKFDYMTILEGEQGIRKSSFVEVLARSWFREMGDFNDKNKAIEAMQGSWILEFAELHQFSKHEITRVKEFLSAKAESSRLAYERNTRNFQRQCIFIGTTNEKEYLKDVTGGRRFWPVYCRVKEINLDQLEKIIDQVWAEVVEMYQEMRKRKPYGALPLYLSDKHAVAEAKEMQASRKATSQEEILAGQIETWLETKVDERDAKGALLTELDGFDDLDSSDKSMLRNRTCPIEIYEKVMAGDRKKFASDRTAMFLIGRAMQLIPTWRRSQHQGRHGSYGKQTAIYVRLTRALDDDEL